MTQYLINFTGYYKENIFYFNGFLILFSVAAAYLCYRSYRKSEKNHLPRRAWLFITLLFAGFTGFLMIEYLIKSIEFYKENIFYFNGPLIFFSVATAYFCYRFYRKPESKNHLSRWGWVWVSLLAGFTGFLLTPYLDKFYDLAKEDSENILNLTNLLVVLFSLIITIIGSLAFGITYNALEKAKKLNRRARELNRKAEELNKKTGERIDDLVNEKELTLKLYLLSQITSFMFYLQAKIKFDSNFSELIALQKSIISINYFEQFISSDFNTPIVAEKEMLDSVERLYEVIREDFLTSPESLDIFCAYLIRYLDHLLDTEKNATAERSKDSDRDEERKKMILKFREVFSRGMASP